jgi:hypothetical protein
MQGQPWAASEQRRLAPLAPHALNRTVNAIRKARCQLGVAQAAAIQRLHCSCEMKQATLRARAAAKPARARAGQQHVMRVAQPAATSADAMRSMEGALCAGLARAGRPGDRDQKAAGVSLSASERRHGPRTAASAAGGAGVSASATRAELAIGARAHARKHSSTRKNLVAATAQQCRGAAYLASPPDHATHGLGTGVDFNNNNNFIVGWP